jgi:hypothetical protein
MLLLLHNDEAPESVKPIWMMNTSSHTGDSKMKSLLVEVTCEMKLEEY